MATMRRAMWVVAAGVAAGVVLVPPAGWGQAVKPAAKKAAGVRAEMEIEEITVTMRICRSPCSVPVCNRVR